VGGSLIFIDPFYVAPSPTESLAPTSGDWGTPPESYRFLLMAGYPDANGKYRYQLHESDGTTTQQFFIAYDSVTGWYDDGLLDKNLQINGSVITINNDVGNNVRYEFIDPFYVAPPAGLLLHLRPSNDTDIIPADISAPTYTTNSTIKITGTSSIDISENPASATHFTVPYFNGFATNTLTACCWFYKTTNDQILNLMGHAGYTVTGSNSWVWYVYNSNQFLFYGEGSSLSTTSSSTLTIPNNTWVFTAVTLDATSVKFYYDNGTGTLQEDTASFASDPSPFSTSEGIAFGGLTTNQYEFDSYLDSVRYYNGVLTKAEIQTIYDAEKPTPAAGTTGHTISGTSGAWYDDGHYYEYSASQSTGTTHYYKFFTNSGSNVAGYDMEYDTTTSFWSMVDSGQAAPDYTNHPVSISIVGGNLIFDDPFYV